MPYFDYNATAPVEPAALSAWREAAEQAWHNPSSPYRAAARAHALLEEAREKIALLVGGTAKEYVFTSGATESNNAVFAHIFQRAGSGGRVLVSSIEHPSVLEPARRWFENRLDLLPCGADGVVALDSLDSLLKTGKIMLVSLLAANNETGVLQPWPEAAELCRRYGVPLHCDATQWIGKLPPGSLALCDYVTASAHKFGGVRGAGFLKISQAGEDFEGQCGGEQENGHRAGTENLPAIRAMTAALDARAMHTAGHIEAWEKARRDFETRLSAAIPGVKAVGAGAPRLWNTSLLLMPRHDNMRWVAALDRLDCQISTGSACATGQEGPSHVLAAMGIGAEEARRAVRVSGGWSTSPAAWAALLTAFLSARDKLDGGG